MINAWVYIISNFNRTTFYIGVTNNIERRILEHKSGIGSVFSSKYKLTILLYFEEFRLISDSIKREKQIKNWHRKWKINLIKESNPAFNDLASDWFSDKEIEEFKFNQDYIKSNIDSETSSE
jgi:putative endonuclease